MGLFEREIDFITGRFARGIVSSSVIFLFWWSGFRVLENGRRFFSLKDFCEDWLEEEEWMSG